MIEFVPQNPKLVQVTRDGEPIGWLNRTKGNTPESGVIWSGIVENRVVKAESLCAAKQQVRDLVDDRVPIDLTDAGIQALKEHGAMRKVKVRVAAARGAGDLADISYHFKEARMLADQGDTEAAVARMAVLKDVLLGVVGTLNFAGVTGRTEQKG